MSDQPTIFSHTPAGEETVLAILRVDSRSVYEIAHACGMTTAEADIVVGNLVAQGRLVCAGGSYAGKKWALAEGEA